MAHLNIQTTPLTLSALSRRLNVSIPRIAKAVATGIVVPDSIIPGRRPTYLFNENRTNEIWEALQK